MVSQLFQVESVCLSWLEKKPYCDPAGLKESSLSAHPDRLHGHYQSLFSRGFVLWQQHFTNSCHLRTLCLNSNTKPDSQTIRTKKHTRASKRDDELRKELQLFLSSQGLPLDKVPSTKELNNCGREDLAKIVRRRGYKAIQNLLSSNGGTCDSTEASTTALNATNSVSTVGSYPAQNEQPMEADKEPVNVANSPDTGQIMESSACLDNPTMFLETDQNNNTLYSTKSLNASSMAEQADQDIRQRAAEFVKTGRLDLRQGPYQNEDEEEEEEEEEEEVAAADDFLEDSSDEEESDTTWGDKTSPECIAVEKAAKLRARLLPFLKSTAPGKLSNQPAVSLFRKDLGELNQDVQSGSALETALDLQRIKSALVSKERELIEITRDLEETKAQLALVQAKATAEVAQAKQIVLEKDIRLKSADVALANLKRVQVEYWGEGGLVELAGSFNGWKYFISMEPDPTSEISKLDGSRGPMMWETELWLYPGVYEIKFIVDGNWLVDQRRELVMRNSHQNNILRVEP